MSKHRLADAEMVEQAISGKDSFSSGLVKGQREANRQAVEKLPAPHTQHAVMI